MTKLSPEFSLSILVDQFAFIDPDAPEALLLDRIARFAGMLGDVEMAATAIETITKKNLRLGMTIIDSQQGHSLSGVLIN